MNSPQVVYFSERRTPVFKPPSNAIALILALLAAIASWGFGRLPGEMRDFEVYRTAAARATRAQPLYRPSDGHYQFKYLPAFAVLTTPIARLPVRDGKALWFVASVALLATLVSLSIQILPERRRPKLILTLVMIVAMGKFYGHELVLGQVNLLFGVLATAAILMMRRRRDAAAAGLLVLAVAVKPYAIVFLPWLVLARGRATLPASVAGMAGLLALPAAIYGVDGTLALHRDWWMTVTMSTAPNLTNADNVSVAGMAAKWLGVGPAASVTALVLTGLLGIAAGVVMMGRRQVEYPEALEGALILTLIPLLSPQGWDYVFLVATPAVALFANYDDHLPAALRWLTWAALATIGLTLFDLMGRDRYAAFMSWSVITVCVLVLVTSLAGLRIRRIA
jgi:hypothetical protein